MIRPLVQIAAAAMCGAIVQTTTPAIGAWERFHGDAANRGFADVDTKPAAGGSVSVPGLGTFAAGAGPVIAPDGTVYLGTQEGKLIALHADGNRSGAGRLTRASRSSPRPRSARMVRSM